MFVFLSQARAREQRWGCRTKPPNQHLGTAGRVGEAKKCHPRADFTTRWREICQKAAQDEKLRASQKAACKRLLMGRPNVEDSSAGEKFPTVLAVRKILRERNGAGSDIWKQGGKRKHHCSHRKPRAENSVQEAFMTVDPVCGMRIDESRSEFHAQFAGKKYSFCSEDCKKEFETDPEEFVETTAA